MAKEFLSRKGITYTEKRVDLDFAVAQEMANVSRQQGVPVIVVDGQAVVGFDRPRLEALLANRQSARPTFGASVADASRILSKQGQLPVFGAYVGKVAPGSAAARLGLLPGDIIVEMNMRPVTKADDVAAVVGGTQKGGRLAVVWERDNQRLNGTIQL